MITGLLPVRVEPSVAVTTCWVDAVPDVVNVTAAIPEPLVELVGAEKLPPFVLLHVTTCPLDETGFPN